MQEEMSGQTIFGGKRDIIILIVLQVVLGSIYLGSVPRVYVDEVWDSSLGYNLARQGGLKHPFIEGFGGMEVHFLQNRVILPFVCAAVFKVAPYSIATGRIGSVIFGVLAVVFIYLVVRCWFGDKQAFWAALATILYPWFFEASRRARPEIYYTALALMFLWLIVVFFDSKSRWSAFFAGVLAGLSALTHPNGLIITFIIGCALILWFRTKWIGRLIGWVSIGFLLVVLPYIIYVLWAIQDPQVSFAKQMQIGMLHKLLLHGEIIRWKSFLQWPIGAPFAAIMFISWIAAWYRSSTADKALATIIALYVLILPFATVNFTRRYLVVMIPFLIILIVRLLWRIIIDKSVIWKGLYKFCFLVSVGAAVIYLLACTGFVGLMFYRLRGADFSNVINHVATEIGPDSRVYGDPLLWLGHDRYQYGPYLITYEEITLKDAIKIIRKHNFDYVVRGAWLLSPPAGIAQPPRLVPEFKKDSIVDWVCRIYGTKVDEFRDPYYGPIEIYKLDWSKTYRKVRRNERQQ